MSTLTIDQAPPVRTVDFVAEGRRRRTLKLARDVAKGYGYCDLNADDLAGRAMRALLPDESPEDCVARIVRKPHRSATRDTPPEGSAA